MLLLAHVCAEFRDRNGNTIFRVTGNDLNHTFLQAPDAIQEDPLFAMLVQDGSIVFPPKDEQEKKRLENEPLLGVDRTGRRIVDAGGVSQDDSEVNRNKRSVRGTAAPIEVAEQSIKVEAEAEKPAAKAKTEKKSAEETKPDDTKPAGKTAGTEK